MVRTFPLAAAIALAFSSAVHAQQSLSPASPLATTAGSLAETADSNSPTLEQPNAADSHAPDDPNTTRLLIGPTARTLKAGESYLDMIGISIPFVQVGITDRLSIGAGSPLLFPGLTPFEVYWLTPKFQLYSGAKTSAAVGVLHGSADSDIGGIAYAVATRGSADNAVTAGVGYAYSPSDGDYGDAPVVMIGAEHRLSPHTKVVTENYAGSGFGMLSGGLRFWRARTTFDFGLIMNLESKFTVPFIRWTVKLTEGRDK